MVEYAGQSIMLKVKTIKDAWWAIDKMATKWLMAIRLVDRRMTFSTRSYIPTTQDIVKIIDTYLKCERANDRHIFPNGGRRPAELHKKIDELKTVIKKYETTRTGDFI